MQREVVLVGVVAGESFERVEHGGAQAEVGGQGVGELGLASRSENTVVMPSSRISCWSRAMPAGVGSASGVRPATGATSIPYFAQ